jgi:hypothetical protein
MIMGSLVLRFLIMQAKTGFSETCFLGSQPQIFTQYLERYSEVLDLFFLGHTSTVSIHHSLSLRHVLQHGLRQGLHEPSKPVWKRFKVIGGAGTHIQVRPGAKGAQNTAGCMEINDSMWSLLSSCASRFPIRQS